MVPSVSFIVVIAEDFFKDFYMSVKVGLLLHLHEYNFVTFKFVLHLYNT